MYVYYFDINDDGTVNGFSTQYNTNLVPIEFNSPFEFLMKHNVKYIYDKSVVFSIAFDSLVVKPDYKYTINLYNKTVSEIDIGVEEKTSLVIKNVDNLLNVKAKEHGYDSILSACSYAGYPNEFQQEAIAFGTWRSAVWSYCYQELDKIKQGLRPEPTIEEFILELPQLTI